MEKYIKDTVEFKIGGDKKIGCICRGTDYFTLVGLSKQLSAEIMIETVREYMNKYNIKKV